MEKVRKIILFLISIAVILLIATNSVEASSSDLFLDNLEFIAQINSDGSMDVTEKWNIQISNTNTLYKTFKTDKTKYSSITNVVVTDTTSSGANKSLDKTNQWMYHLPRGSYFGGMNQDNEFEIAWGVGLDDSSAVKSYSISYQVKDAISKYSDYAELYWRFIGEEFEIDAKNITGTIFLPSNASSIEDIKVWGHTEDLNGEIYATDINKIEFNISNFRAGRYVEIRSLFPTEMITSSNRGENTPRLEEVINEETEWVEQANARRVMKEIIKIILAVIVNIITIVLAILGIKSIFKNIEKIKKTKKFEPSQEIQYYREMPREDCTPAEALSLYNKQIGEFNNSAHIRKNIYCYFIRFKFKKSYRF